MASRKPQIVPDGSVFEGGAFGGNATLSGDDLSLDLPRIKSVGLDDLSAVEAHCINRVYNTVSHFVRFTDGGEVHFVISLTGELLELSGHGVRISLREGNAIYFGPYHSPSNPA